MNFLLPFMYTSKIISVGVCVLFCIFFSSTGQVGIPLNISTDWKLSKFQTGLCLVCPINEKPGERNKQTS